MFGKVYVTMLLVNYYAHFCLFDWCRGSV